jgi:uncharacterized phage infection (PIP) family protein YhgE
MGIPAIAMELIKTALPFIEKWLGQLLNSNSSNSSDYNSGTKSLDKYLTDLNANLSTLQDQLGPNAGFDISGGIHTAADARKAAADLQAIYDKGGLSKEDAALLKNEITALDKAAVELDNRGESGSEINARHVVVSREEERTTPEGPYPKPGDLSRYAPGLNDLSGAGRT